MEKRILVFNAGSSSLRFALFKGSEKIIFGKCDRIGSKESHFVEGDYKKVTPIKIPDYKTAVGLVMQILESADLDFDVIAHRVVHGGQLDRTTIINSKIKKIIKKYSIFAPLHNPFELEVIETCEKFKKPQYAVFDTAFFHDLPEKSKIYPIPQKISEKFHIRRYGFHGISHEYVSKNLTGKIISCHLGNGCSITAIKDKKPIDTSMGLTPLEGVMMGTRAGDLDPGLVIFLQERNLNINNILNQESGFKALTNKTDIREILLSKSKNSRLAIDIFTYKIIKYIGAYTAAMNGLDNLIFTGGIGENIPLIREQICKSLSYLGAEIDKDKNNKNLTLISKENSKIKIHIIKTDEESQIAEEILKK